MLPLLFVAACCHCYCYFSSTIFNTYIFYKATVIGLLLDLGFARSALDLSKRFFYFPGLLRAIDLFRLMQNHFKKLDDDKSLLGLSKGGSGGGGGGGGGGGNVFGGYDLDNGDLYLDYSNAWDDVKSFISEHRDAVGEDEDRRQVNLADYVLNSLHADNKYFEVMEIGRECCTVDQFKAFLGV